MTGLKQKSRSMLITIAVILLGCFSVRAIAGEPVRIMPLGDSITRGWYGSVGSNGYRKPLYLKLVNRGYNVDFVGGQSDGNFADRNHEGHDGWHAAEGTGEGILPNVYNWLTANPADIVLLHIGTNDITGGDQNIGEVNDILDEIDRFSEDITVILALIINRQNYSATTTQFNDDLNSMALDRIASGDDIIIVDMESALNYSTDMADNLHPNDSGYAKMADVWYDALYELLGTAPAITSTPLTNGIAGQFYTYDVNATGWPEPNYALTTYPNSMTIDTNTGLIEWVPTTAGDFNVTVEASNGKPPDANQSFVITVDHFIKFDAASSNSSSSDGDMLSWQHTIGDGDNRILIVGVAGEDSDPCDLVISSVTYDDINMNLADGSSQSVYSSNMYMKTELYYLLDSNLPSFGSHDVVVTYEGNVRMKCGGAISLENVEQQPAEVVETNSNTQTNSISTNITPLTDGAWVVDIVGCGNAGSFSVTALDMVERFDINSTSSTAAGSTKLVDIAEQTPVSWVFDSTANRLTHSVAAFAPVETLKRAVSGHIHEPNGAPLEGVLVSADNEAGSDTSDTNGYYKIPVSYGWSGTVTPTKAECLFDPSKRTYGNIVDHQPNQDYEDVRTYGIYDLDGNGLIGWGDITVIADNWLDNAGGNICDFNTDGYVDFRDFAMFAIAWQELYHQ
jgi:lysophospholipase L1-like esterase